MLADLLTGLRLALIAPMFWSLVSPAVAPDWLPALILVLAIASDYFDGVVARAQGTASARGQLFDHSSDFLFVTINLGALAYTGLISFLLPLLIIVAFSQYVLDSRFLHRMKSLRMSFLGRWNGIVYFGPLVLVGVGRLQVSGDFSALLFSLAVLLSQLLILSTLISIADRAVAPARSQNPPEL